MEYVPCIGNSSYSFWRILLKLYRCFKDGLKICILFFQNPEIIFYHFLRIFNLDIFRALILQICIWSMYLVSATPPTVFGESFWNFTDVLRMVWRYAYCFFRILKLFFITFFRIFNLDIGSICLVSATPPTVLGQSFWNFTGTLQLSFDFTWEICHLLDITAVAEHLAWLAVLFYGWKWIFMTENIDYPKACTIKYMYILIVKRIILYEPCHEKTCLRGFWPGKTQTGLLSYID